MNKKFFTSDETMFRDARAAFRRGDLVIVNFHYGQREIVTGMKTVDYLNSIETKSGWTTLYTSLASFTVAREAQQYLNEPLGVKT